MKLTEDALARFHTEGYVFIPDCFGAEEVELLQREATRIFQEPRPEIRYEKSGVPRTAFAVHTYSEPMDVLRRDPRLIEPLEQIFEEALYVHQFKLNAKSSYKSDVWHWHQDFPQWHREDGMPEPRAMNIAVFLDDVMPINGPLMLVPGSHRDGILDSYYDDQSTSHAGWYTKNEVMERYVAQNGIVAPTGRAGSLLMFHANLLHGSVSNITPYPRNIVYLTLSAVSNRLQRPTRPEYIAHQDFTPITAGKHDALVELARASAASRTPA